MSTQTEATDFALREILGGIAESLEQAQQTLRDREPYDAFGRPNTIYHVPYLDFDLRVTSEFQTVTQSDTQQTSVLRFRPAKLSSSSSETRTEIYSSLKGQFVASVPNEGLPQTVIQLRTEPVSGTPHVFNLAAVVQNTAGELLENTKVEFNYEADTSEALSTDSPLDVPVFSAGEVYTDATGLAAIFVTLPELQFTPTNFFVIQVNVGNVVKSISLSQV